MNRRDFVKLAGGMALLSAAPVSAQVIRGPSGGEGESTVPLGVTSRTPPLRWEDAMLSGNGSTGVMVMGLPLNDRIIVNHEKLWVVANDFEPRAPDLTKAWEEAKKIAQKGRYLDADMHIVDAARAAYRSMNKDHGGRRPGYDRTHPGFHINVQTAGSGWPKRYRRETNFDTGEVSVRWTDNRGDWLRRLFVSRADDAIVMEIVPPAGATIEASLQLVEAPGRRDGDIAAVGIDHTQTELYYHATYGRTMGRRNPEGYHALGRVIVEDGSSRVTGGERLEIRDAKRVLVIMRFEYLDEAQSADRNALRAALAKLPTDYQKLLAPHAAQHTKMFRRVTLDLGGDAQSQNVSSSEELIGKALNGEAFAEFFELLHAAGRYAMICSGTGELPPSLMGIWGNEWNPPWDGRYTFDANLNLAISPASQGNLPEAMETYTAFLECHLDDWRNNARRLYDCGGVVTDLCQGWRHGATLMSTYPWTGGAGWLASYLYDHYLFTQDRAFLAKHVVPLLTEVAAFYADFLPKYPQHNGRYTFYPSISPENVPVMTPEDQTTNVVPNATGEIAICREALSNLIAACEELKIEEKNIPRWQALLDKLPEYEINEDGALAEWAYPGLKDRYNHRHSSHLYPIYPSLEIGPERTPRLFEAARIAMEKRLEAGLGNDSAHGLMHVSLVAARLKNPELMWRMLSTFAQKTFVNTSFITCHNPGPRIYNLDATLSLPAVLMEMLVYSEPGLLELLPALPIEKFPRGTIRGVLARGGITVKQLHWNKILGYVNATLVSQREQQITLRLGVDHRFVNASDGKDRDRIKQIKRGKWQIDLSAERALELVCRR